MLQFNQNCVCVSSAKTKAISLRFIFQQVKTQVQTSLWHISDALYEKNLGSLQKQKVDGLCQKLTPI